MTISAIAGGGGAPTRSSGQSLAANFDNFLNLLTTQLQNQDPLAPMDANSFTAQLVQFASVEQAIQTNGKLAELGAAVHSSATAAAIGLLGQEVSATTDQIALPGGGAAVIRYRLADPAAEVRVSVLDGHGRSVRTLAGSTGAGENLLPWDGTDATGRRLPAGSYTVRIEAARTDGTAAGLEQFVTGKVQAIEPQGGTLNLVIDGATVPMSTVRLVRQTG